MALGVTRVTPVRPLIFIGLRFSCQLAANSPHPHQTSRSTQLRRTLSGGRHGIFHAITENSKENSIYYKVNRYQQTSNNI